MDIKDQLYKPVKNKSSTFAQLAAINAAMEDLPREKFATQLKAHLATIERKVVGDLGGAYKGKIEALPDGPNQKTEVHTIVAAISYSEGRYTAQVRVAVRTAAQGGAELMRNYHFDSWVDADKGAPEMDLDEKQVQVPENDKPTNRSLIQQP